MSVNIRNFVNTNIQRYVSVPVDSTRDTTALFLGDDFTACVGKTYIGITNETYESSTLKSITLNYFTTSEKVVASETLSVEDFGTLVSYLRMYFNNSGVKVKCFSGELADTTIASLDDKIIVLVQLGKTYTDTTDETCDYVDTLVGVKRKIIVGRIDATNETKSILTKCNYGCLALKYSTIVGAEMAIAGYLSSINVYDEDDVKDYDFTIEKGFENDKAISDKITTESDTSSLADISINFDMYIADEMRNIGGNLTNGNSVVDEFILIVLQQLVTDNVMKTLSSKIKGQSGISAIRTSISEILNNFVSSGYLVTDMLWTDKDLYITNSLTSKSELVISKNTPITTGYHIHMFKMGDDRRSVNSYIVLPTAKGIRYVDIQGVTL